MMNKERFFIMKKSIFFKEKDLSLYLIITLILTLKE